MLFLGDLWQAMALSLRESAFFFFFARLWLESGGTKMNKTGVFVAILGTSGRVQHGTQDPS